MDEEEESVSWEPLLATSTSSSIHCGGPRPMWPKSLWEWTCFIFRLACSVALLVLYSTGRCSAIPLSVVYLVGFCACTILAAALDFAYGGPPDHDGFKHHPVAGWCALGLLVAKGGFLVLGLVVVPPHWDDFGSPALDACETVPLVALTVPFALPALSFGLCLARTGCTLARGYRAQRSADALPHTEGSVDARSLGRTAGDGEEEEGNRIPSDPIG